MGHLWEWLRFFLHLQHWPDSLAFLLTPKGLLETVSSEKQDLRIARTTGWQTITILKSSRRPEMMSNNNVFFLFKHIRSTINPQHLSICGMEWDGFPSRCVLWQAELGTKTSGVLSYDSTQSFGSWIHPLLRPHTFTPLRLYLRLFSQPPCYLLERFSLQDSPRLFGLPLERDGFIWGLKHGKMIVGLSGDLVLWLQERCYSLNSSDSIKVTSLSTKWRLRYS